MIRDMPDAEAALEEAALHLISELGWQSLDCNEEYTGDSVEIPDSRPYLGWATRSDVLLSIRLRQALARLNPDLPPEALDAAMVELGLIRIAKV